MFKITIVQPTMWSSRLPIIVDRDSYFQLFLNHPTLWVLSAIIFVGLGVFVFITNYQKTNKNSSKKEDTYRDNGYDSSASANSSKVSGNVSKTVSNPNSTTGSIWTSMMDTPSTQDTHHTHSSVNHSHDSGSSGSNDSSSSDSGGSSSD